MWILPTLFSLARIPLALLFFYDSTAWRVAVIMLAASSDYFDGYLARRYQLTSPMGAILDPLTDKFFVVCAISALFHEEKLSFFQALSLMSRDLLLCTVACYLSVIGDWGKVNFSAVWWGKFLTVLQFFALLAVILFAPPLLPNALFLPFMGLGLLVLFQYLQVRRTSPE
jgi:CDP-diacylglycerol--glycerol-3-phosphate 3-phosphatidyltransferase